MSEPSKCQCVYATAANTPAVRKGYEMGGYVKQECESCKASRLAAATSHDPLAEYSRLSQQVGEWP